MNEIIHVIYTPSKIYKVEILKRERDGLYSFLIHKWIEHDLEIKEIMNQFGFWGPLRSQASLTDTAKRAIRLAIEDIQTASGETIRPSEEEKDS